MVDLLGDNPKVVNVKFQTDEEKQLHTKFKARCALMSITMQERIVQLIESDVK